MRRMIFFCLAVLFPINAFSIPPRYANLGGAVTINDTPAERSSALFAGDKLATGPDGTVLIQDIHATVRVGSSTDCIIQEDGIGLHGGIVSVRGSISITAGLFSIRGNSHRARFVVSMESGKLLLHILEGAATVRRGSVVEKVSAGQTRRLPDVRAQPTAKVRDPRPVAAAILSGAGIAAGTITSHIDDKRVQCISSGVLCAFAQGH